MTAEPSNPLPGSRVGRQFLLGRWFPRERVVVRLCYAAVALPLAVLAAVVWYSARGSMPAGDEAVLELAVRAALKKLPLVGLGSPRLGVHHPGPLYVYLLIPFYWLSGQRFAAIALAAVLINLAACWSILAVVHRRAGRAALVWTTLLLLLHMQALGMATLAEPWTAAVTILPSAALVVLLAAVAQRHIWYLAPAVALGSFLIQTHLVHAPAAVAALVALLLAAAGPLRFKLGVRTTGSGSFWKALAAVVLLGALLWVPPLVEQWQQQPGNLTRILQLAAETPARHGWQETLQRTSQAIPLGIAGRGLDHLWGRWAGAGSGAVAWLLMALLPVGYLLARRGRRSFEASLALMLGVLLVVSTLLLRRTIGGIQLYLLWWMSNLGMLILVVVGGAMLPWLGHWLGGKPRRPGDAAPAAFSPPLVGRVGGAAMALLVAIACAANVVDSLRPSTRWRRGTSESRQVQTLDQAALRALQRYKPDNYQLVVFDRNTWSAAAGMVLALERQGVAPRLERDWAFLMAPGSETRTPLPDRLLLYSAYWDARVPSGEGLELLARTPDLVLRWRGLDFRASGTYSFARLEEFAHDWEGFGQPERSDDQFFRWSLGERSVMRVPLCAQTPYRVRLWGKPLGLRKRQQELTVLLGHYQLGRFPMPRTRDWLELELLLPAAHVRALSRIEFRYAFVESPRAVWGKKDPRRLAVCFREICFEPLSEPDLPTPLPATGESVAPGG